MYDFLSNAPSILSFCSATFLVLAGAWTLIDIIGTALPHARSSSHVLIGVYSCILGP